MTFSGNTLKVNRTALLQFIVFSILATFVAGCQQEQKKVYRVGILCGLEYLYDVSVAFKGRMQELGYVEGDNVEYEIITTNFDPEVERKALDKFVADEVDLILTFPTEVSLLAKEVTAGTGIPVVFTVANIEGVQLVESVSHPGGNITGVRYPGPDIAAKRFELMQEIKPGSKRVMIPFQKGYPIVEPQIEILEQLTGESDVELIMVAADGTEDLARIMTSWNPEDAKTIDFILFLAEPLSVTPDAFAVIGRFGDQHQIPIGGSYMVSEGYHSIFGVNISAADSGQQAAEQAHRVLSGNQVGAIPVLSAESFVDLDLKGAGKIGLEIPQGVIHQADNLIR